MARPNEAMDIRLVAENAKHSFLDTTFPLYTPVMPGLRLIRDVFTSYIRTMCSKTEAVSDSGKPGTGAPFIAALLSDKATVPTLDELDDKMLTENADVAYRTTQDPLVDLCYELESAICGTRFRIVLEKAWSRDSKTALKIISNARSIHLVRPVIRKKFSEPFNNNNNNNNNKAANAPPDTNADRGIEAAAYASSDESDFEMVHAETPTAKPVKKKPKFEDIPGLSNFDIKHGGAHGYWKDLVNILALAAKDELRVDGNPREVLNVDNRKEKPAKCYKSEKSKKEVDAAQYARLVDEKLIEHSNYTALHMTVARLFAEQLQLDMQRLESGSKQDLEAISMVSKWAPSHKESHDRASRVVSSIAEIMFPFEKVCPNIDPADRMLYLKYARQEYHFRVLPKLRKHLKIVERPITANKFDEIQYDRVPSLTMKAYTSLFARKDFDHFDKYIENVAQGRAQISVATLIPSTLVHDVISPPSVIGRKKGVTDHLVTEKLYATSAKALEGQWNTLVQRMKDSGNLESSIAVCDVSGSMSFPSFPDNTTPMDSSIGLSLLLAEVTKPPFGGALITFSEQPQIMHAGGAEDKQSFSEKVQYIMRADWGGSTNFVAVFEKLILPMAVKHNLKKEDMVQQVFVFSDLQFNSATDDERWTTSYERVQQAYKEAGYDMPHLIFWNLAGGRGVTEYGENIPPKPVAAA